MSFIKADELAANAGEDAALLGLPVTSNPYPETSMLSFWWILGWYEVIDEDFGIMSGSRIGS